MLSDNRTHCRDANSSGEFISSVVTSSQNHNTIVHSQLYLHNPGCEGNCAGCYFKILQSGIQHYMHTIDFNACHTDIGCASWLTLCEERVYGINFQIDDPTFSAVSVSFTLNFHQCFAVYPLPMYQERSQHNPSSYTYHIVHGSHQQRSQLRGFTVQNPYDTDSVLSIDLTGRAIGWDNGEELVLVGDTLNMQCREVIWVEPILGGTDVLRLSLSGTVLSSTTPLNVFTNTAVLDNGADTARDFEYNSQLVHQMPERSHWGKHFIVNPRNSEVLPQGIRSCLAYVITIVSYTARNRIFLRGSNSEQPAELGSPTTVLSAEHYEHTLFYSQAQMIKMTYLEIVSTSPIVVLSEAYASTACQDNSIYYSTLVQPVEWHANKQIVVLVHPKKNITYRYLISVIVPSEESNPADIFESEPGDHCHGLPISSYHASQHRAGAIYTLLTYVRSIVNSVGTQTKLILRHSDPNTRIGVTVYAYADGMHYSYSNGYTLGMYTGNQGQA